MNAERRRTIKAISEKITALRVEVEDLLGEEQDYYDSMPEAIQNGSKGEKAQSTIDHLQEAVDSLDAAENACENAVL